MARSTFDATADSSGKAATAGLALFVLLVVSIPMATMYSGWSARQTLKANWDIEGPPCPVDAGPLLTNAPKAFDYGDVRFARRFGHVSCIAASDGGLVTPEIYRVCQFTGPGTIIVGTQGRTVVFKPGVGRTATVRVDSSQIRACWAGGSPPTRSPLGRRLRRRETRRRRPSRLQRSARMLRRKILA